MSEADRGEVKYLPCTCALTQRSVWAILLQHAPGKWRVVNCLDKDPACFRVDCVFTTDGGAWPFDALPVSGVVPAPPGTPGA
ncbi:MAG TPA: hypothetical protein VGB20_04945 [bacterium]